MRSSLILALCLTACGGSGLRSGLQNGLGAHAGAGGLAAVSPGPNGTLTFNGALGRGDTLNGAGRFEDSYRVALHTGDRVRVDLVGDYDTIVLVRPPAGAPLENDDVTEGDLNSRLQFTAHEDGTYEVVATSFEPRTGGTYRLTVRTGTAIPRAPAPEGPTLASGVETNGALETTDLRDGERYVDTYRFDGRRGDLIVLNLGSPAFDTVLSVQGPGGEHWDSDDITGANTNSRVQATLPDDGTYAVRVTSYRASDTGTYTLRLVRAPRRPRGVASDNAVGGAGPNGTGSVYGIYVGIRDYGGEAGDLPHCDDDATELARAMRTAGVQSQSQQIVLTNEEATGDAVRRAFGVMAQRVTEDDVLVFFYSGHGSQTRGQVSVTEPDGLDETIRLRGGTMRDDAMAGLVAPIRGTVLFALDSCYSGGFARDVISAPRRIGLFSSEEDTLSNVAPQYNAGGYLSYWLRLGVAGAADTDHDGTLRVGELVDYLYGQFGAHRNETNTTSNGGGTTFQNLVVARGSVVNTDLLFSYPQ